MAAEVKITFDKSRVMQQTTNAVRERMIAASRMVRDEIKSEVGIPYPPSSAPGNFPHLRTGRFQRSIKFRTYVNKGRITFYSDDPKAPGLEYGTRNVAPRPTFRLAMAMFQQTLQDAIRANVRGTLS